MRKQAKSRKVSAKKAKPHTPAVPAETIDTGRRGILAKARNGVIGLAVVGGAGAYVVHLFRSTSLEHDLSRVDNGIASVVQIHDPQCQLCLTLQAETRRALRGLDDDKLDYVIADIRTEKGQRFANRYGVQHVTLLLFDKKGKLQQVINGQRPSAELRQAFMQLVTN